MKRFLLPMLMICSVMLTAQDSTTFRKPVRKKFINSATISAGVDFGRKRTYEFTVAATYGYSGCMFASMTSFGGGLEFVDYRGTMLYAPKIYLQHEVVPAVGYRLDVLYDYPREEFGGAVIFRPSLGISLGFLDAYYSYTFGTGSSPFLPQRSGFNLRLKVPVGIGNWDSPFQHRVPFYNDAPVYKN